MKNLFLPYEIAKKLKELGFDEPCLKSITETGFENNYSVLGAENWNKLQSVVSIPMYQQAVDWLREKHYIIITIDISPYPRFQSFGHIKTITDKLGKWTNTQGEPLSYYKALNGAIEEALNQI